MTGSQSRREGVLAEWNDDRGFGFITPTGGGPRAFVHISAFPGRGRPKRGLKVSYAESRDERNRTQASAVQYVGRAPRPRRRGVRPAATVSGLFLLGVVALGLSGFVWIWVPAAYALLSLVSLLLYRTDKRAAEAGDQRVMELVLHAWDVAGGWPGALVARHLYRHKTTKQPFVTIYWLTVGLNCLALLWLVAGMPTRLV